MKYIFTMVLIFIMAVNAEAAIETHVIEYNKGDQVFEGYLAFDNSINGKRPGVLIIHQWKGLGKYERMRAEKLAELGYVAFAADVYGKGVRPSTSQEAGALAGKFKNDTALYRENMRAGLEELKKHKMVDSKRLAAIGYCFGGTGVLELARDGAEIAGVVSFHGGLATVNPAKNGDIKCKILVQHGADDPHVPAEEIAAFQDEMRNCGADWLFVSFGGAVHSFTDIYAGNDKSRGAAYDEKADARSWEIMKVFFNEIF